jgi:hypothetical protein
MRLQLLRHSRKMERGAKQFLTSLAVRAAPFALLTTALAVTCLLPAFAQDPSAVLAITREVVKEGQSSVHEKTDADFPKVLRKAKFPYHVLALGSMSGANEVWFIIGYPSFADVEKGGSEFQKQPLRGDFELQDARDGEHRVSSRSMTAVYRKDLSYHPELASLGKTRFASIGSYRVKLGHTEDMMAGAKAIYGAWEKANLQFPVLTYEVIAGVPDGLFLFIEPMESLKTLDGVPARDRATMEAMGAENFSRFTKATGDVFTSMETNLFSVDPMLSYMSKEVEDVDPEFWRPKPAAKPAPENQPKEKKSN